MARAPSRHASLSSIGQEPDPRFTFANERTFLAWIRTALGLIAAGVGLAAFAPELVRPGVREGLAIVLIAFGTLVSGLSYPRWRRSEIALRTGTPLPRSWLVPVLGYGLAAVAVVTALILLLIS